MILLCLKVKTLGVAKSATACARVQNTAMQYKKTRNNMMQYRKVQKLYKDIETTNIANNYQNFVV